MSTKEDDAAQKNYFERKRLLFFPGRRTKLRTVIF